MIAERRCRAVWWPGEGCWSNPVQYLLLLQRSHYPLMLKVLNSVDEVVQVVYRSSPCHPFFISAPCIQSWFIRAFLLTFKEGCSYFIKIISPPDKFIRGYRYLFRVPSVWGIPISTKAPPTGDNVKLRHFPTNYVKLRQITAFRTNNVKLRHFPTFYRILRHFTTI